MKYVVPRIQDLLYIVNKAPCSRTYCNADQHLEPFLQPSAPADVVMVPTRDEGLAPRLDALA